MNYCYICSPYRGGPIRRIRNQRYAKELTRQAIRMGYTPITPHLYLTQVLNDNRQQEREKGLELGLDLLNACGTMLVGQRYGITEGMQKEITQAARMCVDIKYRG